MAPNTPPPPHTSLPHRLPPVLSAPSGRATSLAQHGSYPCGGHVTRRGELCASRSAIGFYASLTRPRRPPAPRRHRPLVVELANLHTATTVLFEEWRRRESLFRARASRRPPGGRNGRSLHSGSVASARVVFAASFGCHHALLRLRLGARAASRFASAHGLEVSVARRFGPPTSASSLRPCSPAPVRRSPRISRTPATLTTPFAPWTAVTSLVAGECSLSLSFSLCNWLLHEVLDLLTCFLSFVL